jgi:hypothetical protein
MKKIVLIILVGVFFGLLTLYGIFSPYNYFTAKRDIRMQKFRKVLVNKHPELFFGEKSAGLKYGFDVINIETKKGINPIYYLGIKSYNHKMKEAYIQFFGERSYKRYLNELDSIYKHTYIY